MAWRIGDFLSIVSLSCCLFCLLQDSVLKTIVCKGYIWCVQKLVAQNAEVAWGELHSESRLGITNCLCMRALAYRITYRGVLSRQKRWNKGGHRDWKFLFFSLFVSLSFIFLFFLKSHLVTWGEMDRNWQHTCCCWQQSHCSCSLDMKEGEKR